jgi:MFS transporter, NNP family, nitrate/nitrite transporter
VPILISVALLTLIFGTDHPAGKWADRHRPLIMAGVEPPPDADLEKKTSDDTEKGDSAIAVLVHGAGGSYVSVRSDS